MEALRILREIKKEDYSYGVRLFALAFVLSGLSMIIPTAIGVWKGLTSDRILVEVTGVFLYSTIVVTILSGFPVFLSEAFKKTKFAKSYSVMPVFLVFLPMFLTLLELIRQGFLAKYYLVTALTILANLLYFGLLVLVVVRHPYLESLSQKFKKDYRTFYYVAVIFSVCFFLIELIAGLLLVGTGDKVQALWGLFPMVVSSEVGLN